MSYKRVVKRKGKSYGPYVYESYRDKDGKVKKRYLGKFEEKKKMPVSFVFPLGVLIFLFLIGVSYPTDILINDGKVFKFTNKFFSKSFGKLTGSTMGDDVEKTNNESEEMGSESLEESKEGIVEEESNESNESAMGVDLEDSLESGRGKAKAPVKGKKNGTEESKNDEKSEKLDEILDDLNKNKGKEDSRDFDQESNLSYGNFSDVIGLDEETERVVNKTTKIEDDLSESIEISPLVNLTNETLKDLNGTNLSNETLIEINLTNKTLINKTLINKTLINETLEIFEEKDITTLQYKAIINRPVRWIKKIDASNFSLDVELPREAENISILTNEEVDFALKEIKDYENSVEEVSREKIVSGALVGKVALDTSNNNGFLTRFWNWLIKFTIPGNVILEKEISMEISKTENSTIIDLSEVVASDEEEVAIEYYTPAPLANEKNLSNGKRIVVYAPDEFNYEEILAYAVVENLNIPMGDSKLKLYWLKSIEDYGEESLDLENVDFLNIIEGLETNKEDIVADKIEEEEIISPNGTGEDFNEVFNPLITGKTTLDEGDNERYDSLLEDEVEELLEGVSDSPVIPVPVDYVPYDFDKDGLVDYIEWIVPHLSAQTYEIIVEDVTDSSIFIFEDVVDIPLAKFSHLNISGDHPYDHLVLYMPFDEDTSGTYCWGGCWRYVWDYSVQSEIDSTYFFSSTGHNQEFNPVGKYGGSYYFDGTGDVIYQYIKDPWQFESSDPPVEGFSFGAWFEADVIAGHVNTSDYDIGGIMSTLDSGMSGGYSLSVGIREKIACSGTLIYSLGVWGDFANSNTVPVVNRWYHAMCVYNGTHMNLYVDGVFQEGQIMNISESDAPFFVVGRLTSNLDGFNFQGKIDEVMVFDTNLSSSEVEAIYNATSPRFKSSGTQTLKFENISGLEGVTIDANFKADFSNQNSNDLNSSKMEARVGYWNVDLGYNESDFGSNNNLVAYWHADGNGFDSLGEYNLTYNGDFGDDEVGVFDRAFGLDGNGDHANSSLNTSSFEEITVSAWIKATGAISAWDSIVQRTNTLLVAGWGLNMDDQNNITFWVDHYSDSAKVPYNWTTTAGPWRHVVGTYDGTNQKIYLDGVLGDTEADEWNNHANGSALLIGIGNSTYPLDGWDWRGHIDEVMIFNRSLNATEIKELYIKGRVLYDYTPYKDLSVNNHFAINNSSTIVLNQFKFSSSDTSFYGPILYSNMSFSHVNLSINVTPNAVITLNSPLNSTISNRRTIIDQSFLLNSTFVSIVPAEAITYVSRLPTFFDDHSIIGRLFADNEEEITHNFSLVLPANISTNPLLLLHFENLSSESSNYSSGGSIFNYGSANLNGTINSTNSPTYNTSNNNFLGGSFDFTPGSNETIHVDGLPEIDDDEAFSISAWVRNDEALNGDEWEDRRAIFAGSYSITAGLYIDDGKASLNLGGISLDGDTVLDVGKWYHVAATYSGSTHEVSIYVDGVLDNSHDEVYGDGFVNFTDWNIGYQDKNYSSDNSANPYLNWDGSIDEVVFWDSELTAAQISSLHQRGDGVYYWKVNSTDIISNSSSLIWQFESDTVTPTLTIDSPLNSVVYDENDVEINISSSEEGDSTTIMSIDSLVTFFRMEDFDGSTLVDTMGHINATMYHQSSQNSSGRYGSSLDLDGEEIWQPLDSVDYASWTDTSAGYSSNFSYGAWYKMDSLRDTAGIFSRAVFANWNPTGYSLQAGTTYPAACMSYPDSGSESVSYIVTPEINRWYHAMCVHNGTNMLLYVDGILRGIGNPGTVGDSGDSGLGVLANNLSALGISLVDIPWMHQFDGNIDNAMLFNRSLSAEEVMAIYNATSFNITSSLEDGVHNITVFGEDFAGNLGTSSIYFAIGNFDVFPPTVLFNGSTPVNNSQQFNGTITVEMNATDDSEFYAFVDLDRTLTAWWRAEEGANDTVGDYNGAFEGNATTVDAGRFGKGFSFDGDGDYVNITDPDGDLTGEQMTISWWHYQNESETELLFMNRPLYDDSEGIQIFMNSDNRLRVRASGDTGLLSSGANWQGQWVHGIVVFNGTNATLYRNGVFDKTASVDAVTSSTYDFLIGILSDGVNNPFNGTIDEVLIFNRSLNSSEVLSLYNATANHYLNTFENLENLVTHNITGYAVDVSGSLGKTETREIIVGPKLLTECINGSAPVNEALESSKSYLVVNNITTGNSINCFFISAENVTLDLGGHTLHGETATSGWTYGVYTDSLLAINAIIKNGTIKGYDRGIWTQVGGGKISNLSLNNSNADIFITSGNDIIIEDVNASGAIGLYIPYGTSNITLRRFNFSSLVLHGVRNSLFEDGVMEGEVSSPIGLYVYTKSIEFYPGLFYYEYTTSKNNIFRNINISSSAVSIIAINDFGRTIVGGGAIKRNINNSYNNINLSGSTGNILASYYFWDSSPSGYDFNGDSLYLREDDYGEIFYINRSLFASGSNLSNVINIGNNSLFVNTTLEPGLNTSANITLLGLSLNEPEAEVDYDDDGIFEDCDICTNIGDYNSSIGLFQFNTTHFTSYRASERPRVTLVGPADASSTTNRTPEFNWTAVDADGDIDSYQWNLTDYKFSGTNLCEDDRLETITTTNFIPTSDLECLYDHGYYYTWRVRANDSVGWGPWSDEFTLNITAVIDIGLDLSNIYFGENLDIGDGNDTADDSPLPFVINNGGNTLINISLNSTALWSTQSTNSSYYQFKADNVSGEEGAFNWLRSITEFTNIPLTGGVVALSELNYIDNKNSCEVDIRIEVPQNELSGTKNANITFIAEFAEDG